MTAQQHTNNQLSIRPKSTAHAQTVAFKIVVSGFVQSVGYRPYVYRLASELSISGYVVNNSGQVSIVAEADAAVLDSFCQRLISGAPVNARPVIDSVSAVAVQNYCGFEIRQSYPLAENKIHILPDLAVCDQCLNELFDKQNRRYLYPFINCTQCGPRYSIIHSLPYDRENTSMHSFSLCKQCEQEYLDQHDRRFHAEPLGCEQCGPVLNYVDAQQDITNNDQALKTALQALAEGKIVAVKGIAGYHLMCDATSSAAVATLRQRKNRPDKPLGVLMAASQLEDYVEVDETEKAALEQTSRPLLLLKIKSKARLAENVAPKMRRLGVMLPGSALQVLLCHYFRKPLVATSANLSGEPIIISNAQATIRLAAVADAFLHNNREILRPADDPVVVVNKNTQQILRSGRGITPAEFKLPFYLQQPVLAVGGHTKNSVALAWEDRVVMSAQNGELGQLQSYERFQQAIEELQRLYQVKAERLICDQHPGYNSTQWAQKAGLPVTPIYHHQAHASSLMLEQPAEQNWLVFCWDGIGLGEDGALWGGETFSGYAGDWERIANLKPFKLPGGEKTAREAWRIAASLCWESGVEYLANNTQSELLKQSWKNNINCPQTSAVGRLFSAAAASLGLLEIETYEGHGPMLLEALAETTDADGLELPVTEDEKGIKRIDWQPLIKMLHDNSLSRAYRARCFHITLALCIRRISLPYLEADENLKIGFSGGVFQNQLLLRLLRAQLAEYENRMVMPATVAVNDSGLCIGQIIEYYYQDRKTKNKSDE